MPFRSILAPRTAVIAVLVWPWTLGVVGAAARRSALPVVESVVGTALMYLAARHALRARTRGAAIGRLLLAKAALTFASIALTPANFMWFNVAMMAISAVTRVPLSLIVPVAIVVIAWPVLQRPSHEAADRALIWMAIWMVVPDLVGDAFTLTVVARFEHFPGLARSLAMQFVFQGGLPLAIAAAAVVRLRLRRRWLSRVESGLEPAWRLVDADMATEADLPVLTAPSAEGPRRVLARVSAAPASDPFREADRVEPVALVRAQVT